MPAHNKRLSSVALSVAVMGLVLIAGPALAASGTGWEAPATGLIETLQSGLVKIGTVLIGVGVIAFGMWGAITARIDWMRFAMILIGGLLVMVGPAMITLLLESTQ